MTILTIRRLPGDIIAELKARAGRNARSLEGELRAILTAVAIEPAVSWRCFHCGDVFTNTKDAASHFGLDQLEVPGCVAVLRRGESHLLDRIRDLELQVRQYEDGSTDMQRWAQSKFADHSQALIREEEKGYARGVRDTLAMPEDERAKLVEARAA